MGARKYIVCHLISSTGLYGAESVILNIMQGMKDHEIFNCILGCIEDSDNRDCELFKKAKEMNLEAYQISLDDGFNPKNIFILKNFLKKHGVDIVHSHGYKPTVLAYLTSKFFKVRQLTTCHLWTSGDIKHKLYEALEAWVIKRDELSIAVSGKIKNEMIAKGIPQEVVKVIPNGINIDDYQNVDQKDIDRLRKEFDISGDTIVIGNLARLTEQKGHKYLIEAAKRIVNENANVIFIIAGEGELKGYLMDKIKEYHIESKVKFLGFRNDGRDLLKLFDIFVLPSIDEGTPMALLEAMAAGCAIVATKVGGIPDVIDDNVNGFLVEPGDVKQLSEKLLNLIEDKEKREKFVENAKEIVGDRFSTSKMVSEYSKNYSNLIKTEKSG